MPLPECSEIPGTALSGCTGSETDVLPTAWHTCDEVSLALDFPEEGDLSLIDSLSPFLSPLLLSWHVLAEDLAVAAT
jgi:hypothetical protein